MKKFAPILFLLLAATTIGSSSCARMLQPKPTEEITKKTDGNTKMITYAEFVQLNYTSQKGEIQEGKEWYVRMSVQDYFIKWCECAVSIDEIENLLEKNTNMIKTLEIELEIKSGDWDNCDPNVIAASRGGKYAVIHHVYVK